MHIKEIDACISFANQKSIRLAEKIGFVLSDSTRLLFRDKEYLHNIYFLYLNEMIGDDHLLPTKQVK